MTAEQIKQELRDWRLWDVKPGEHTLTLTFVNYDAGRKELKLELDPEYFDIIGTVKAT